MQEELEKPDSFWYMCVLSGGWFFFLPWGKENHWPFRKPVTSLAQSSWNQLLWSRIIVKGNRTPHFHTFSFLGLLSLLCENLGAECSGLSLTAPHLHYTVMKGEGSTPPSQRNKNTLVQDSNNKTRFSSRQNGRWLFLPWNAKNNRNIYIFI